MKKNLYTIIFCILICTQIACGQTQPKTTEQSAQTKTTESKSQVKTEEIKTYTEQTKTDYPNLKTQADEMGVAFSANDFNKFADFMHPKLVKMAGGKNKFISSLDASMEQMKSAGFELISYEMGEPIQTIEVDNQIFSVVPTETVMKLPKKTVTEQGSILAVSEDKGANWKFVRVTSKESLKRLFPNAIDQLTFPEKTIK